MTHTCPVCGNQGENRTETGHYICSNCALWFSDPMKQANKDYYQDSPAYSHRNKRGSIIATLATAYHKIFTSRVPEKYEIVENELRFEQGPVLDTGCGDGAFLKRIVAMGYLAKGVDHDPQLIETLHNEGLCLKNQDITEYLDTTNERYKVVTMFDVLEHLEDPVGIMKKVKNILINGGCVYISVPMYGRKPKIFDPVVDHSPHHLTLWGYSSLQLLAHESGFEMISYRPLFFTFNDMVTHLKWRTIGILKGTPGYTVKGLMDVMITIIIWPVSAHVYGPAAALVKFRKYRWE